MPKYSYSESEDHKPMVSLSTVERSLSFMDPVISLIIRLPFFPQLIAGLIMALTYWALYTVGSIVMAPYELLKKIYNLADLFCSSMDPSYKDELRFRIFCALVCTPYAILCTPYAIICVTNAVFVDFTNGPTRFRQRVEGIVNKINDKFCDEGQKTKNAYRVTYEVLKNLLSDNQLIVPEGRPTLRNLVQIMSKLKDDDNIIEDLDQIINGLNYYKSFLNPESMGQDIKSFDRSLNVFISLKPLIHYRYLIDYRNMPSSASSLSINPDRCTTNNAKHSNSRVTNTTEKLASDISLDSRFPSSK